MANQSVISKQAVKEFLGEVNLLAGQIGSADGLAALAGSVPSQRFQVVRDLPSLRRFLHDYHTQVLIRLELPVICRACEHANRFEVRELIALDRELGGEPLLREFATASQRVGKAQLKRLRPLRDQRLVQRYLRAVEAGEANAWHTVVYGLVLSLYSFPLRQGLMSYARQTMRGFVGAASGRLRLGETDEEILLNEAVARFPEAINSTLTAVLGSRRLAV